MKRRDEEDLGPGELSTDEVYVRSLVEGDLEALVRIDRSAMGRPREAYFRAKLRESLEEGGVRTSLVAELDGHVVGFVLARVYYGEFGQPEPVAVLDSIGVDPDYRGREVGRALMRQLEMNLRALRVERIDSIVDFRQLDLLQFMARQGFMPAPRYCLSRGLN